MSSTGAVTTRWTPTPEEREGLARRVLLGETATMISETVDKTPAQVKHAIGSSKTQVILSELREAANEMAAAGRTYMALHIKPTLDNIIRAAHDPNDRNHRQFAPLHMEMVLGPARHASIQGDVNMITVFGEQFVEDFVDAHKGYPVFERPDPSGLAHFKPGKEALSARNVELRPAQTEKPTAVSAASNGQPDASDAEIVEPDPS